MSRDVIIGIVSAIAPTFAACGGAYQIIKSGIEKKGDGGPRTVPVNETVTVGPYDRILVAVWTRNASARHEYRLKDDLVFTVAGDTSHDKYRKGFKWVRATDWDAVHGNPDTDSAGSPAWSYHFIPFDRGAKVWYTGRLHKLTDFGDGAWRKSRGPKIFRDHLLHPAWATEWNRGRPVVQWKNPTGTALTLNITGSLVLEWLLVPPEEGADDLHYAIVRTGVGPRRRSLAWEVDRRLRGVVGVFPHPTIPRRVAVSTSSGLAISSDRGRTWRAGPKGHSEQLGDVNWIAFAPDSPDVFYVASDTQGVWATADGGHSLRRIGSGPGGLAHDRVLKIYVYPHDRRFKTLLAIHGDAAPGISRSENGGRSWKTVTGGFHVYGLTFTSPTSSMESFNFFMAASRRETPEVRSVWAGYGIGDHWLEIIRDVLPTAAAAAILKSDLSYCSTADTGLYRLRSSGSAVAVARIGPDDADEWTSVGVTLGARPKTELVYAFEPRRLGLVVSEDGMQTFTSHKRGLFLGPYVREGAHVRANANGTAFFAAVNGLLYAGRIRGGDRCIVEVDVEPAVFSYARDSYVQTRASLYRRMRELRGERNAGRAARRMLEDIDALDRALSPPPITISARLRSDGEGPVDVAVNLGPLGAAVETPMYDDGRHGDGGPGDGVYAVRHDIRAEDIVPDRRYRGRDVRGTVALWVTATRKDDAPGGVPPVFQWGHSAAWAPGVFSVYGRPESFVFWNEKNTSVGDTEGQVSVETDSTPGAAREGRDALKLSVGPGRWLVTLGSWRRKFDITGYHALSFWIRTDARAGTEVNVHLSDFPENAIPAVTPPVPVAEHVPDKYRLVAVPVERLREEARNFQPNLTAYVVFSGEARSKADYWLDDIRFWVSEEDLEDYRREASSTSPASNGPGG